MKVIAVYLMLKLGGNDAPSKADITQALAAVGVDADASDIEALLKDLDGKDLDELLATGKDMLATFGGGGGGGGGPAGGAQEAAEEEEKEEEEEEEADIGGGDMFGGGDGGDY